jgi:prepilin-type N-terminal cleavage/methylation domain-containing protein
VRRGFTVLELLVAMAMFAVLGTAVVALLSQGLGIFSEGTADTSMQDRLQAIVPTLRADLASIQPVETMGVPPPIAPPAGGWTKPLPPGTPAPPQPEVPVQRVHAGTVKLTDLPTDAQTVAYWAFVRTNARESEDPQLRQAGSTTGKNVELRRWEPAAVDSGVVGDMMAPGGLVEVLWIAVPEDVDRPGILTLYRGFRAPAGGPKTLLDPKNFDSLAKVKQVARVMQTGVLDFRITFRNVFASSWEDGLGTGRVQDGMAYVGTLWDSTRGLDEKFPLFHDKQSATDVRDDVFPAMARIDLTLANPGPYGFTRGDTRLAAPLTADGKTVELEDVNLLLRPGVADRAFKVDAEWMGTRYEKVDLAERRVVVTRGERGTVAREHLPDAPVYVGSSVATDVPLVWKDRYVRSR